MIIRRLALASLCLAGAGTIQRLHAAQPASDEAQVRAADDAYWRSYNACDLTAMAPLLTMDAEFYHDKTGLTTTRAGVVESIRHGICSDPSMRLRREVVPASVQFHAMAGGYALETGMHRFYVRQKGKDEYLDGEAGFTVVWKRVGSQWQMHRILSYDHGPAPYQPPRPALTLSVAQLAVFAGHYVTPKDGDIIVTVEGDHLRLKASHVSVSLYPSAKMNFFAMERDLRFAFTDQARVLTVIEKGGPVAVATRVP
ncbi:MAG: nuclear transport factor 2 family protein [Rhodanobacter sp.]